MNQKTLAALFALFALFVATGCQKPPAAAAPGSPAVPAAPALRILCWPDYTPAKVLELFTKETGIPVEATEIHSQFEMALLLSTSPGYYDIAQPSSYGMEDLMAAHLLLPLDRQALPNLANIAPEFLNLPFDPGNRFSVPYMAGLTGIVINTEVVKGDIRHYADIARPEWKGRLVAVSDPRDIVSWAALGLGLPVDKMDAGTLEKTRPVLQQWFGLLATPSLHEQDSGDLLTGRAVAGAIWSGEAAALIAKDPKLRWIVPEEETRLFLDNLCVSAQTLQPAQAMKFLNFILRPDVSKMISDEFPYTNPNLAARKLLTPAQLANPASYPPALSRLRLTDSYGPIEAEIERLMSEVKEQSPQKPPNP